MYCQNESSECYKSPLLMRYSSCRFPQSFHYSFCIVFGDVTKKNQAFDFLQLLNKTMEEKRGGGILKKSDIINLRQNDYCSCFWSYGYNTHHVKPRSRDSRRRSKHKDQEIKLPKKFHQAWHHIFVNLYHRETMIFLEKIFYVAKKNNDLVNYYRLHTIVKSLREGKVLSRV